MIKINLLPIRAARKRESVKQQLILGAVLLIGAGVGLYLWYNSMATQIDDRNKQISTTKQQIEQYKRAIGEVEKYKGLEEKLKRKLEIIESLVKGKTGPVRVLDRMSQLVPKQVWLMGWTETSGGSVTLEGEAVSNKYVAQFITALKDSSEPVKGVAEEDKKPKAPRKFFTGIRLVDVEALKDDRFVKFKIVMKVNYTI
jgi:type IV pilus assembly protein PilN